MDDILNAITARQNPIPLAPIPPTGQSSDMPRRRGEPSPFSDRQSVTGWRAQNPGGLYGAAGQISDYTGAAALLDDLPKAQWLLADRGYDADWFRDALEQKGIKPCIPGRKSRSLPVKYDKRRYKRRNRIEIMFGRLKDWRRVATRYDRCPIVFCSALALAATVLFWL